MLVSLGWAFPTKQVRRYVDANTFRSEPAVRRLNLQRLCEMTGTSWLLARDRQHADRNKGKGTVSFPSSRQRYQRKQREQHQRSRETLPALYSGRSTGDPPGNATIGAQALSDILDILGKG